MNYREILHAFEKRGCNKILDAGCGSGRFVDLSIKITGLEKNPSTNPRIKKGDVTKMPFKNESFDGVLSYQVIEHLDIYQAYKMLAECHRILTRRGVLILESPWPFENFWDTFSHVKPYTPNAIRSLLEGQDGVLVENFPPPI